MRIVTVFGGSGFLGRHVVRLLAHEGFGIRAAMRHPELAGHLKPLGGVGQIVPVQANVRDEASIARAVEGAEAVVNLVGILYESGRQTFAEVHARAPGRIAAVSAAAGVERLVHVSAIGAERKSPSAYARSKAAGEAAVREAFPDATILRPSVVFGPEDDFFNKFGAIARLVPILPVFFNPLQRPKFHFEGLFLVPDIEAGTSRMQPVYVGDVARAVHRALSDSAHAGKVYELGGPSVYTYRELMALVFEQIGRKGLLAPVPFFVANILGFFGQLMPVPPITVDQARQLRLDNVVAEDALGLANLGITPTAAELILPTYMHRYRRGRSDSSPIEQL